MIAGAAVSSLRDGDDAWNEEVLHHDELLELLVGSPIAHPNRPLLPTRLHGKR